VAQCCERLRDYLIRSIPSLSDTGEYPVSLQTTRSTEKFRYRITNLLLGVRCTAQDDIQFCFAVGYDHIVRILPDYAVNIQWIRVPTLHYILCFVSTGVGWRWVAFSFRKILPLNSSLAFVCRNPSPCSTLTSHSDERDSHATDCDPNLRYPPDCKCVLQYSYAS
jgi:hypothetical protein